MADLLGFGWKVIVILAIVAALAAVVVAGADVVNKLSAAAKDANPNLVGQPYALQSPWSMMSLVKPLLQGLTANDGAPPDVWELIKAFAVLVPTLITATLVLHYLIRSAK